MTLSSDILKMIADGPRRKVNPFRGFETEIECRTRIAEAAVEWARGEYICPQCGLRVDPHCCQPAEF